MGERIRCSLSECYEYVWAERLVWEKPAINEIPQHILALQSVFRPNGEKRNQIDICQMLFERANSIWQYINWIIFVCIETRCLYMICVCDGMEEKLDETKLILVFGSDSKAFNIFLYMNEFAMDRWFLFVFLPQFVYHFHSRSTILIFKIPLTANQCDIGPVDHRSIAIGRCAIFCCIAAVKIRTSLRKGLLYSCQFCKMKIAEKNKHILLFSYIFFVIQVGTQFRKKSFASFLFRLEAYSNLGRIKESLPNNVVCESRRYKYQTDKKSSLLRNIRPHKQQSLPCHHLHLLQ